MNKEKWNEISKFDDSEQSPGFLLWKTQLIWRRKIERVLAKFQLTHPQFVILASIGYLTCSDKIVSQIELANHTMMDINTTSQILRSLEQKELIIRQNKIGNIKTKYSNLTHLGYQTLEQAIKGVEAFDHEFFSQLSKADLEKANDIFSNLIRVNI